MKSKFYNNNECLRNSGIQFPYTDDMIKEIKKCKKSKKYFIEKYCKIIHQDKGLISFKLYRYQKRLLKLLKKGNRIIVKAPRQSGKTILMSADILHHVLFNDNKICAIVAHKASGAREVLTRVKLMYEMLPIWLQQGILVWNKTSIGLENNSEIITGATTSSSIRGKSISYLYLDEFAFVSPNLFEEFYNSVYPTVASAKTAKIVMTSTPFGLNHFYKFWTESVEGLNGFSNFPVEWDDVPGRTDKWRLKTIGEIGERQFRQEFETEFLGSSFTLLSGEKLKQLAVKNPLKEQFSQKFKIYELPKRNNKYVAFCDVAEGVQNDYSTVQVIDVTEVPYRLVASYNDNEMPANIFHTMIDKICKHYNEALVVVENNTIGSEVNNMLFYEAEYENVFYDKKKMGLRMTKQSKRVGCAKLKLMIESDQLVINDFDTIYQFSKFGKKGLSYEGENGANDDLITPLILFSFFMSNKFWVEKWLDIENLHKRLYQDRLDEINNIDLPCGFYDDGIEETPFGIPSHKVDDYFL